MKRMLKFGAYVCMITLLGLSEPILAKENDSHLTEEGIEYSWLYRTDGVKPVYGDSLHIEVTILPEKAREEISSEQRDKIETDRFILGLAEDYSLWESILLSMSENDVVMVNHPSFQEPLPFSELLDPEKSWHHYRVSLVEVSKSLVKKPYDIEGKTRITTASDLQFILLESGSGIKAAPGYTVTFHFTGYLEDGTVFASSHENNEPVTIILGVDRVMPAWEEGLELMREGEKMRFIVPPEIGFSESDAPAGVLSDSLIIFDIEMLKVE